MVDRLSVRLSCLIYSCINVIYKPLIAFAWSPPFYCLQRSFPVPYLFYSLGRLSHCEKGKILGGYLQYCHSVYPSNYRSWSLRDGLNVQTAGNVQLTSQRSAEGYPGSKGCWETFLWINSCTRSEWEEKSETSHRRSRDSHLPYLVHLWNIVQ